MYLECDLKDEAGRLIFLRFGEKRIKSGNSY
jgi:hypothetical protein